MMKLNLKPIIAVFIIIFSFLIPSAQTCTIFSLYPNNQHWIGRTFDWAYGHGLVFTNKRNVTKTSIRLLPTDVVSSWTSKYGSVTFNQFGREFPTGGMNETGLVVEALELKTSIYPAADSRPSFNELQFIQFLLDNYSRVEDVMANLGNIRLSPVGSKLHYFVCDINKCMTIEYINGELVTHAMDTLPISSLANHTYDESIDYAKDFITFGGQTPIVQSSKESLNRFVRASYNAKFINQSTDQVQDLFSILADVGSLSNRWQIIYNQDERVITFRTTAQLEKQRKIELLGFNFDCQAPVKYFDLDSDKQGAITFSFKPFDSAVNLDSIKKSVALQKLPEPLAARLSIYPNETKCNE